MFIYLRDGEFESLTDEEQRILRLQTKRTLGPENFELIDAFAMAALTGLLMTHSRELSDAEVSARAYDIARHMVEASITKRDNIESDAEKIIDWLRTMRD